MPQIPRINKANVVNLPQISPNMTAMPYVAQRELGEQITQTADFAESVRKKVQDAQDKVTILQAENDLAADLDKASEGLRLIGDHNEIPGYVEKMQSDLYSKYQTRFENNPRVAQAFSTYLQGKVQDASHAAEMRRIDLLTGDAKASLMKNIQLNAQKWFNATDAQKLELDADTDKKIDVIKNAGFLTAVEALAMRDKYYEVREEGEIITLTRSQDPAQVQLGIDRLSDNTRYTHIDEKERSIYLAAAETRKETLSNRIEKEQHNLKVEQFTNSLDRKFTGPDGTKDFKSIASLLDNVDWREKNGIDNKVADSIRNHFEAVRIQQDSFDKKMGLEQSDAAADAYTTGDYAKVLQIVADPNSKISPAQRKVWKNAVKTAAKQGSTGKAGNRVASSVFDEVETKIISGEISDPIEIYDYVGKGLNGKDAARLRKEFYNIQKDREKQQEVQEITDAAWRIHPNDEQKRREYIVRMHGNVSGASKQPGNLVNTAREAIKKDSENSVMQSLNKFFSGRGVTAPANMIGNQTQNKPSIKTFWKK